MFTDHPKVVAFIAHGGLLGMTEAVDAGVPMVVIPFFGDQPGNAAAAAAAGLATVLPYRDLTEASLQQALQKVLSPEMRESAAKLSTIWRDRPAPPLDTAVYWVERAARLGPAAALHSPARDMPVHQLLLLDVLAVCLAAVCLVLLLAFYLVKILVYFVQVALNRKNKEKIN
ncbi:UDP-glucuronosyltransferase 2C1 [Eumeta japonica]|uniref:UDP-glucuronosyltransferase 2C1 n=1 Tax=Eumeta variegata TaxID=151549 RepID=A0A4C1YFX4_EUMVA|nr:UDP-glucuronosyltransferase 2C1 [Eumeta japonica]